MDKKQLLEMRNKPAAELQKLLLELRGKLWHYKVDLAAGKVKNIKEIKMLKKGEKLDTVPQ